LSTNLTNLTNGVGRVAVFPVRAAAAGGGARLTAEIAEERGGRGEEVL
jgi:hypothetical protein